MATSIATIRKAASTRREIRDAPVIAPDVAWLPLSIVNAYLIGPFGAPDREWALVDAGLPFSADRIVRAAAERFGPGSRPSAIILTHGHFDHVGAAKHLADLWDAPVYAHPLEMPYLTGRSAYPPPDPLAGGGAMAWMSLLYPRGPVDLGARVRPLPVDGMAPGLTDWRWIFTPGHSPGHVALFRESDGCLIAGDAFVTTRTGSMLYALTRAEELNGPPAHFTPDWALARRSVETLAALDPQIAATGHGRPMSGETLRRDLARLARDFDQLAIPRHGRYRDRAAIADESGVVSVPPPVVKPEALLLGGLVVGLAAGALLKISSRSDSSR